MNELKKLVLASIGGASMSYDKLEETINNLAIRGQITVDEGKKLSEELIRKGTGKSKDEQIDQEELQSMLLQMNVAQRKDIEDLEKKIAELNNQIDELVSKNK